MADTPTQSPKFRKQPAPEDFQSDGTSTLHLTLDPLQSIYVYADELLDPATAALKNKQGGTVTFVSESGAKVAVLLIKTWFPAGTWSLDIADNGTIAKFKVLFPADLPQKTIDAINLHSGKNDFVLQWKQTKDSGKAIKRMLQGAAGHTVRLVVSFSKAKGGNAKTLPEKLALTASDIGPLSDETLARLYIAFVEHFGGVPVDERLAENGLNRDELDQIEQNRPEIIAITDLFLQAFGEFQGSKSSASPSPDLSAFQAMTEAIFFQKKVNNDLAKRNMLMIGMGSLLFTTPEGNKDLRPDIGVIRRTANGGQRLLLYDRFGQAVRGVIGGFIDTEFRSIDLQKANRDLGIPQLQIPIDDEGLYRFLRGMEQNLGQPVREIESLVASYYKYSVFINAEIHRRYSGEIGQRLVAMAPVVVGFFVAHAFGSFLLTVQPLVGAAFLLLVKGAGLVLGIDALLLDMGLMAEAGRHFTHMEQLGREEGDEKPRLTKLSEGHLKAGARALLDAIADIVALGIIVAGGVATAKFGPAMVRGMQNQAKARLRMTIEKGEAVKVEPVDAMKEVKTPVPKAEGENAGLGAKEPKPGAGDPPGTKPIEHADAYKGDPVKGKTPEQAVFKQERPKALDQTAEQFERNTPEQAKVQKELFDKAKEAVDRQNAFIQKILAELNVKGADAKSLLKRDALAQFVKAVAAKVRAKQYKTVSEMTDIIRGRIDFENPADLEKMVAAMRKNGLFPILKFQPPRKQAGVENGYPRAHIEVVDPQTGMVHEWQIGPKQATEFFEKPGIDPAGINIKPENTNIHDIEYRIFKSIEEPARDRTAAEKAEFKQLSEELGIPAYRKKVAAFAARMAREKIPPAEFEKLSKEILDEASVILKTLVDKKGKDFPESFLR